MSETFIVAIPLRFMSNSFNRAEDAELVQAVQESLQQMSIELEHPQDAEAIQQLYQQAQGLLNHLSPDPLTVARVTGVLLVYQLPGTDLEEIQWFESELQNSPDLESIEELVDSIFRPDAL